MTGLFTERERAAEGIFVQDEKLRFLAIRHGLQSLGAWAADGMGLDPEGALQYQARLVDDFVGGASEPQVVTSVQSDLERAGKPALSTNVATVFAQAVAEASETLRHGPPHGAAAGLRSDVRHEWEKHHQKQGHGLGWSL